MTPRSGRDTRNSSSMSCSSRWRNCLSRSCFTMKAAICEFRSPKSITLPSPISLSTDTVDPSPKVASLVVSSVEMFEM